MVVRGKADAAKSAVSSQQPHAGREESLFNRGHRSQRRFAQDRRVYGHWPPCQQVEPCFVGLRSHDKKDEEDEEEEEEGEEKVTRSATEAR